MSDYLVAIDQQARTTLRNAFGNVSLDEALSSREQINAAMQQQMEQVTDKWGIRINRIEIVDISPPVQILQAMALQKQADQEKRARILQSEGQQQSAVNIADGNRQAAIKQAEGERQAAILRAEGNRQAAILEAEGRAQAISTVYGSIKAAQPDPTLVAILQLDTLTKFADSPNAKLVVPAETSGLLGAAQVLRSVLGDAPDARAADGHHRTVHQLSGSSAVVGQSSLFGAVPDEPGDEPADPASHAPLATRMRPRTFDEFVGQHRAIGIGTVLRRAVDAGEVPSLILWGPPGSGKTTLAVLIAGASGAAFEAVSATSAGVADLRKVDGSRARAAADGSADRALHRRDPSLQQEPAGRGAPARRERDGHAARRDHREPVVRGQRGAAVAQPRDPA